MLLSHNQCGVQFERLKIYIKIVDTGGGLQIIKQLRDANIDFRKIHNIILSHKHTDHILGMFWIIRYSQKFSVIIIMKEILMYTCIKNWRVQLEK